MEIVIGPDEAGTRLDIILTRHFPGHSRGYIQKAIRQGHCLAGTGRITDPAEKARAGQSIIFNPPGGAAKLEPSAGVLDILWQDDQIAVCSKPAGLTVHPCPSCREETLANRLLAKFPQLADSDGMRPGIVHRLDKDTSGLIVIALTEEARLRLSEAFAGRRISKEYLALVAGVPPETGECREPIGRHPAIKTRMAVVPEKKGGRDAFTQWRRIWNNGKISLLRVRIHTGRTHQIRVHLAHCGFPVAGDAVYAPAQVAGLAPRQMLHAWRLCFAHPLTGESMSFRAPAPDDFFETALGTSETMKRIIVTGNQGCGKSTFQAALAATGLPAISADQAVADLYGGRSAATEWIAKRIGQEAINRDGSVNKSKLFEILQKRPEMRPELERAIHGLVLAEIERFWQENENVPLTAAEIPLYFESGFPTFAPQNRLVVGIDCPAAIRWQRLAASRGWTMEKIALVESWQWPERRKMNACDEVISNCGSEEDLRRQANEFLARTEAKIETEKAALLQDLRRLCS